MHPAPCSGSLELTADLARQPRRSSDHRGTAVGVDPAFEGDVAAIDQKIGGGDEGRVVGGKVDRTRGDFLRLARPIEQVPWPGHGARPLLAAGTPTGALGEDEAGRDRVGGFYRRRGPSPGCE